MEFSFNPFQTCFTRLKLKYSDYDKSIEKTGFVSPSDKVNVFINFESVLNNLSFLKDIENKLLLERNFPFILESETLNLCAHYKRFFKDNNMPVRIFLYYTDLTSEDYKNFVYNDEFRSFYENKFLRNPKYQLLGNRVVDVIIPRLKKITEFIPNVYFLSSKDFDCSLIPKIISDSDPTYKNFIITTDKCDTQYHTLDNFMVHYIKRLFTVNSVTNTLDDVLKELFKEENMNLDNVELFRNPSFLSMLCSVVGSKSRSIETLKGIGPKTFLNILIDGIKNGVITESTSSIDMIKNIFEDELQQNRIANNFKCINILSQIFDLNENDKYSITIQMQDRFDFNSLRQLNEEDYKDYPLMLEELT